MSNDPSTILTIREVAQRLKCSTDKVRHLIICGRLRAFDIGAGSHHHYRVTQQALDAFLDVTPIPAPSESIPESEDLQTTRFLRIS